MLSWMENQSRGPFSLSIMMLNKPWLFGCMLGVPGTSRGSRFSHVQISSTAASPWPRFLWQVSANTENSSMSGYLQRSKGYKKPWKRLWFVIKNKVLYTYAASEVRRSCSGIGICCGLNMGFDGRVRCVRWRRSCVCAQDVAALESQPLLGFFLREEKSGPAEKLQFKLYHKNILYYIFRADDIPTAQRYTRVHSDDGINTF